MKAPPAIAAKISDLVIPWVSLYCIATVVSFVALGMKISVFRSQLRERRLQLTEQDSIEQTRVTQRLHEHRKRLIKTKRSILMLYSSMCGALLMPYRPINTCSMGMTADVKYAKMIDRIIDSVL